MCLRERERGGENRGVEVISRGVNDAQAKTGVRATEPQIDRSLTLLTLHSFQQSAEARPFSHSHTKKL